MNIKLTKKESKEINLKINTKHLTFEERIKNFEKLPVNDKGTIELYDWGEDLEVDNSLEIYLDKIEDNLNYKK